MKHINAVTLPCPIPVIMAKKEIKSSKSGESFVIEVDNLIACKNLEKMVTGLGHTMRTDIADGNYLLTITLGEPRQADAKSGQGEESLFVIAISANTMGSGDDALGDVLMRAFLSSVAELDKKPDVMLFFNGGVKLTTEGSQAIETLREIASAGVNIISCGACLDFYKLKDRLLVGEITNMFNIVSLMSEADKLINL